MSTKAAIIATIVTFVLTIIVSIILLVVFIDPRSGRAEQRAGQLGQGVAIASLVPIGGIWISWAVRVRKQREQK